MWKKERKVSEWERERKREREREKLLVSVFIICGETNFFVYVNEVMILYIMVKAIQQCTLNWEKKEEIVAN